MKKPSNQEQPVQYSFKVTGMTCAHCERKVESLALTVTGILAAVADTRQGLLRLECAYGSKEPELFAAIDTLLRAEGYGLVSTSALRSTRRDLYWATGIGMALAGLFLWADLAGVFALVPVIDSNLGVGMLFVIGLLTSLHCVSMCGGIALSQGVRPLRDGTASGSESGLLRRLTPSLLYNAGRISSYTLIGAVVGAAGSALQLGFSAKAFLMALAGVFMLLMGLSMAGLIRFALPAWPLWERLRGGMHAKALRVGPYAVGLANGLMPCGPLQAMQLYALGSGSAVAGALAMFAFSAGTAPLLFLFGAGGALVSLRYRAMAVRAGAVLVAFLGLTTLGRAWSLSGWTAPVFTRSGQAAGVQPVVPQASSVVVQAASTQPKNPGTQAVLEDGIQTVQVDVGSRSYGDVVVQAGIPVRMNLYVAPGKLNGCNNAIVIPSLKLQQQLAVGDNFVEFTPQATGVIPYSCWMGMINAKITVVESATEAESAAGVIDEAVVFPVGGSCCQP